MKKKILLINDDIVLCEWISLELRSEFDVITCLDAVSAFRMVLTMQPDVIVLDTLLSPRLSSKVFDTFNHVSKSIPILAIIPQKNPDSVELAIRSGARDYVCWPVEPIDLLARIRFIVTGSYLVN